MVQLVFRPIPRSDDRFARQDRCRPLPEFPLGLSCQGIVHHLSGTITRALAPLHWLRRPVMQRTMIIPRLVHAGLHFHCAMWLCAEPSDLSAFDSLVHVSRRVRPPAPLVLWAGSHLDGAAGSGSRLRTVQPGRLWWRRGPVPDPREGKGTEVTRPRPRGKQRCQGEGTL